MPATTPGLGLAGLGVVSLRVGPARRGQQVQGAAAPAEATLRRRQHDGAVVVQGGPGVGHALRRGEGPLGRKLRGGAVSRIARPPNSIGTSRLIMSGAAARLI